MTFKGLSGALRVALLSATILAGAGAATAWAGAGDGDLDNTGQAPLPTGQFITPTFATGATFAPLNPFLPEYTPAINNYPYFHPNGAIASTLSPDGKTLAVMTSGYNVLDDVNANLVGNGAEFIILYDVSNPRSPVQGQTIRPLNTFVGLAFSNDGKTMYVSGGADDDVIVYTKDNTGTFNQTTTIDLGHGGYNGLPPNGLPGGIGYQQYAQSGGLALSRDGSLLVIANSLNNSVSVISTATNAVLNEYDLRPYNTTPATGDGVAGGETLYTVAVKGDATQGPITIYATSVRDREVVVSSFNPATSTTSLVTRIAVSGSPNNIILNRAQTTAYVSQDNSDKVAVIDTASNTLTREIDVIAPAGIVNTGADRYTGAASNNVALSPDETTLYVTNGGANDVAVVSLTGAAPAVTGLIPTGWYPTTVTVSADGGTLYIFNNKNDPGQNPNKKTSSNTHLTTFVYPGGNSFAQSYNANQYVFQLEQSGMLTVPVPSATDLPHLTTQVAANNGWSLPPNATDAQVMGFLRSHIQHVIYIVKENRTFDQVLGDLTNGANGDSAITIFGKRITPNFHKIATNFVTLDNFFDTGEVSGNGWPWSTAGRETDWNEKNIPMNYTFAVDRGDAPYDAEGQNNNISVGYPTVAARQAEAGGFDYTANANQYAGGVNNMLPGINDDGAPDGKNGLKQTGYIWDAALRAGLTVRNYGFFSDNSHYGLSPTDPGYSNPIENPAASGAQQLWTAAHTLIPYTDIYFRGFDNAYPDTWRLEEFEREFATFDSTSTLPSLILLRYMHDHMGNFARSTTTPPGGLGGAEASAEIEQADNDFAVGKTVDLIAHSQNYAGNTLIFVLEDDAQDGGDHMDAHRSTAYVVGPYVALHKVVSTRYSTVSMLRTIEDVLGLEHLNLNTAYQRPMTDVFSINQGPSWTYTATASTILKTTTLNLSAADPQGRPVEFAEGPDLLPTRPLGWWAEATRGFDFSGEDRVPAGLFNQVTWEGMMDDKPYPTERSGIIMHGNTDAVAQPASLVK